MNIDEHKFCCSYLKYGKGVELPVVDAGKAKLEKEAKPQAHGDAGNFGDAQTFFLKCADKLDI